MAVSGNEASDVPTLNELISEQKRVRGFSYAELERRAGEVITRQRWQQLGTGVRIKEFPEPATLRAMAEALDVNIAAVVLAAARSIGLDVTQRTTSDLAAMLPPSASLLTPEQRDAILSLVRSIVTGASHERTDTEPATPPATQQGAQGKADQGEKNNVRDLNRRGSRRGPLPVFEDLPEEDPADAWAARKFDPRFPDEDPDRVDTTGEESQDPEDWENPSHDSKDSVGEENQDFR